MVIDEQKTMRIRALNDQLRMTGFGLNARVVVAGSLATESPTAEKMQSIVNELRAFKDFPEGDDPYHEHDFGVFTVAGVKYMFKIDYYALDERHGSEHPDDPNVTVRIMSVFYAADY